MSPVLGVQTGDLPLYLTAALGQVRGQIDRDVRDLWGNFDYDGSQHPIVVGGPTAVGTVLVGVGMPGHFAALSGRPSKTVAIPNLVHSTSVRSDVSSIERNLGA